MKVSVLLIVSVLVFAVIGGSVSAVPTQIHACSNDGCVLTIPRYKIFMSMNDPDMLWAIFQNGGQNNFIKSVDGGSSWNAADSSIVIQSPLDYHSSLGGDNQDNLYVADRCGECTANPEREDVFFRKIRTPANSTSDLEPSIYIPAPFSGNIQTPNILVQDQNNIFVIMRNSGDANGNVYYARSTNGGTSFSTPQLLYQTNAANVRIGSLLIEGMPAAIIHYVSAVGNPNIDYQYLIWDGNQFVQNNDSIVVSGENTAQNREYSMIYVNGELHLVYNNGNRLRHAWKLYNNGQGSWNYADIETLGYDPLDWHPSLTKYGNDLYMFYVIDQSTTGSVNTIYYRKWNSATSLWSGPIQIGPSNSNVRFPHGPAAVNPSADYIPVIWSAGDNYVWFDTISATSQTGQYANCNEVPLEELGGKPCLEVTSCGNPGGILNQADTYYLLKQNITADDSCIAIANNNITFDLNGYKITYAINPSFVTGCPTYYSSESGNICHHGISYIGSYAPDWNGIPNNGCEWTEIKNGFVEQYDNIATYSNGIHLHCQNYKVHDLTVHVKGDDDQNIYTLYGGDNSSVYNNLLINDGTYVSHRDYYPSVIYLPSQNAKIYNNTIIGGPDVGITVGSYSEVFNNDIQHNQSGENAFGIMVGSGGYNDIHDNYIHPFNGRGLMIDNEDHNLVYNNVIEVKESGTSRAYALRLRSNCPVTICNVTNNSVFNNTVTVYAGVPGMEGHATALIISDINYASWGNKIYNNTFRAITYNAAYQADAVGFDGVNPADNGNSRIIAYLLIVNNVITGNNRLIDTIQFPGNDAAGYNFEFVNPKFVYENVGDSSAFSTLYFDVSSGDRAENFSFLNASFGGGASFDNVSWGRCSFAGRYCNYFVKWFLDIEVLDGSNPATGATVTIVDNQGSTIFNNVPVDAQGEFNTNLTEYMDEVPGSRVDYSPYNVSVTYNGELQWRSVTLDQTKTEIFTFGSVVCPDVSGDAVVNIIDMVLVIFHQGIDNNNPQWDNYDHLDVNNDTIINFGDVSSVISSFGQSC